jgi:hypothetical protein
MVAFIFEGREYDTGEWGATHHPGGPLLMEHVNGTDATAAIRANHPREPRRLLLFIITDNHKHCILCVFSIHPLYYNYQ